MIGLLLFAMKQQQLHDWWTENSLYVNKGVFVSDTPEGHPTKG
jgi:hypothetical protein